MIVCGLKLTHDGAVAVLDGDRLLFSVEVEKLANRSRYSDIADLALVPEILAGFGLSLDDIDTWVIDGWDGITVHDWQLLNYGRPARIRLGPYRESAQLPDPLTPAIAGEFEIGARLLPYTSYSHAAGHLASTYWTSPAAAGGQSSFVLLWDGGLFPMLYWVDPGTGVECGGELFPLIGHAYAMAGLHFGPFGRRAQASKADELSVAGKLMAYIALGQPREQVLDVLRAVFYDLFESDQDSAVRYRREVAGYGSLFERSRPPVDQFFTVVRDATARLGVSDEDILASVHLFLQELLVCRAAARARAWKGDGPWNLCLAGGCALNIKWNSALRASPVFDTVWVPPFPNDSGSALVQRLKSSVPAWGHDAAGSVLAGVGCRWR